jgi:hypothetical protein
MLSLIGSKKSVGGDVYWLSMTAVERFSIRQCRILRLKSASASEIKVGMALVKSVRFKKSATLVLSSAYVVSAICYP